MLCRLQCRQWKYLIISGSFFVGVVSSYGAGFISTPDTCFQPERIEKGTVYLKRIGVCSGKTGRVFVDTDLKSVNIDIGNGKTGVVQVETLAINDISSTLDKASAMLPTLKIPENVWDKQMTRKAEETNSHFQSPAYQTKLLAESERLKNEVLDKSYASYYPDSSKAKAENKEKSERLPADERVYIFVSSSMPMQTIRNYIDSVVKLNDPNIQVVMRGFIGGVSKIGPTISFISAAIKDNAACNETREKCTVKRANINIDPLLFRKYEIDKVPAVVYAKGVVVMDPGMSEGKSDNVQIKDFYSLFGDASLEYCLSKIASESGSKPLLKLFGKLPS